MSDGAGETALELAGIVKVGPYMLPVIHEELRLSCLWSCPVTIHRLTDPPPKDVVGILGLHQDDSPRRPFDN